MSGRAKVKQQYCQHWEQRLDSNLFVTLPCSIAPWAKMRFDTTLAPLPLWLTFLCEGLWAFLGVLAEEQLIVDVHGENGGC